MLAIYCLGEDMENVLVSINISEEGKRRYNIVVNLVARLM